MEGDVVCTQYTYNVVRLTLPFRLKGGICRRFREKEKICPKKSGTAVKLLNSEGSVDTLNG